MGWARVNLCADPVIYWLDGFASEAECRHVRDRAACNLEPALVEADGYGARRPSIRTCSSCWLQTRDDAVLEALEDRICDVVGCCEEATEFFHVVRYRAGTEEQYKPHLDAYDLSTPRGQRTTARGGQRLVTALLYLSTISADKGGCTVFSELGLRCPSRRGRLLVFHNSCAGSTDADPRLRHAGEPVKGGSDDKWVCNKWIREFPLRARRNSMMSHLYGQPAAVSSAASRHVTDVIDDDEPDIGAASPNLQSERPERNSPSKHDESCDQTGADSPKRTSHDVDCSELQACEEGSVLDRCTDKRRCVSIAPSASQLSSLMAAAHAWKRQRVESAAAN